MRIPFPDRIPIPYAFAFGAILFSGQLLAGTSFYFATCVFAYVVVATLAFNIAGGLFKASGIFIFANAVLGLILSQCAKVLLMEPAQSNLRVPNLTITVYLVGEIGILIAIMIAKRFRRPKSLLDNISGQENFMEIAAGCFVVGLLIAWLVIATNQVSATDSGSTASFLRQLGSFLPLAVILATYHQIKVTNGRESINAMGAFFLVSAVLFGVYGSTKEGILEPVAGYLLTCAVTRFRFKPQHIVIIILGALSFHYYLYPFAQTARNSFQENTTFSSRLEMELNLLTHPSRLSEQSRLSEEDYTLSSSVPHYYNTSTGLMERFSLIPINSHLIERAGDGYSVGWYPLIVSIENNIPHFLWPNKPTLAVGNFYAHQIGLLAADDTTTGISFGLFSEAYYIAGWAGLLVVLPIIMLVAFMVWDWAIPDLRTSPWGLVVAPVIAFYSCQYVLSQIPSMIGVFTAKFLLVVIVARFILPPFGSIFLPRRQQLVPMRNSSGLWASRAPSFSQPISGASSVRRDM